jgi:thymidine phosphorylase
MAAFGLGAGRVRAEDPVDFGVGLMLQVYPGDVVEAGQPLARVLHRDGRGLDQAMALLGSGVEIGPEPRLVPPLIHEQIRR